MKRLREDFKLFIPPIVLIGARRVRALFQGQQLSAFEGPYSSWQGAMAASDDGWDSIDVLEKTLDLSLKMRDGLIEFQQDLIEYNRIIYSETILAFLAMASGMHGNSIEIVDFGGSLGTNFTQNKKILRHLIDDGKCKWNVVERPPTVKIGRNYFEDKSLQFFVSLDELMARNGYVPTSFLFSGSTQCIEQPFVLLDEIIDRGANLIAFDRLFVSPNAQHEIFIQHHMGTTYPTWCFSRNLFVETIESKGLSFVEEFSRPPTAQLDYHRGPDRPFYWVGMIFARDKPAFVG
jgi:putative methyltransferase (TIGR04325 family)